MEFSWKVLFREQEQGLEGGKLGRVQAAVVLPDTGPTAGHGVPCISPPTHRLQKTVLYICVSFAVLHTGLSLPSF